MSSSDTIIPDQEQRQYDHDDKTKLKQTKQQLLADFLDLTERIIENLFQCGKTEESLGKAQQLPPLADFGWMIIHRCQLTFTNIVLAILYLIRLKQRHPSCKGAYGSGHRLFLAALIVGNKYLYDDAYHNYTWAEVSQGAFQKQEVNRMEFELIYFLNFSLNVTETQWLDLVDLLDNKLHSELMSVNCKESRRYRLSEECGVSPKPLPGLDLIFTPDNELSEEEGEESSHVLLKEIMNQNSPSSKSSSRLISPLQDKHPKPHHKPTPPTPQKMLHLPLHHPPTTTTSSDPLQPHESTTLTNGYVRKRRGSQLKFPITSPSKLIPTQPNPTTIRQPNFTRFRRNSSALPQPNRHYRLTESYLRHPPPSTPLTESDTPPSARPLPPPPLYSATRPSPSSCTPPPTKSHHPLLHHPNPQFTLPPHLTAHHHNQHRRKSLPALPITTSTTSQVNFYVS